MAAEEAGIDAHQPSSDQFLLADALEHAAGGGDHGETAPLVAAAPDDRSLRPNISNVST
jgi:hypothetical protein